jgi:3-isopropylmalate dehydrogenase
MTYDVVLLPGDGIGPEVMEQGRAVLEMACRQVGAGIEVTEVPCGGRYYLEHGKDWPEGSEQRCEQADVLLLGAVGWPSPLGPGPVMMADGRMAGWSAVLGNRRRLDLYANVRPIRLLPGVRHRLHQTHRQVWEPGQVDLVMVRENTEGLYAGVGRLQERDGTRVEARDERVITRRASERVIRKAFALAAARQAGAPQDGRRRVTCVAKDNVLLGCQLFVEVFAQIGREHPEVEKEYALVDAFAQALMVQPEHYQVCVTTNMFGDILTDLGAVLQGGMGMAVGCNVGERHGMFEPIHGSAPSLAGKDKANPLAMILSVGEALRWLGESRDDPRLVRAAAAIGASVEAVVAEGSTLTGDLVGEQRGAPMTKVAAAVRAELARQLG